MENLLATVHSITSFLSLCTASPLGLLQLGSTRRQFISVQTRTIHTTQLFLLGVFEKLDSVWKFQGIFVQKNIRVTVYLYFLIRGIFLLPKSGNFIYYSQTTKAVKLSMLFESPKIITNCLISIVITWIDYSGVSKETTMTCYDCAYMSLI